MTIRNRALASVAAASLAACGFALGRMAPAELAATTPPEPTAAVATPSSRGLPAFADLAERVSPAVVFVKSVSVQKTAQAGPGFGLPPDLFGEDSPFRRFAPPPGQQPPNSGKRQGTGTGFIVRADGLILTNHHVVDNAKEITVTIGDDEQEYSAKVVGTDPKTDLAVLKIDPKGALPVVPLGNSDGVRVGDWVMAIGNPFGLNRTVTAGIVSAKGRVIGAGPYDDFIQTDASINPGNSGGPLFNEQGEAVGINSAIYSQNGGNIGIGFAIPINLVKQLLPELEEHGHVTRGWLGVAIQKVTPELAHSLELDGAGGALVSDVTGNSPAAKAGLERGDVIVRFDGKPVHDSSSLPSMVAMTPIGKDVPVELMRNGKAKTVEVRVAKLDDPSATTPDGEQHGRWGMRMRDLRPEERERYGLADGEGVLVVEVEPDSPAAEAGISEGDVVLRVNRQPVASAADASREVAKVKDDKPLLLLVRQVNGQSRFAALAKK